MHDSPDYHQLKVSVFNDDKRTDLIGETWVNLNSVLVRGGGRADGWHSLHCKGRYAGDIRLELTYYDTRPKEEPPAARRRESERMGPEQTARDSLTGPRQLKPVTRRPLPPDPVSGSSPGSTEQARPSSLRQSTPKSNVATSSPQSRSNAHSRAPDSGKSHSRRAQQSTYVPPYVTPQPEEDLYTQASPQAPPQAPEYDEPPTQTAPPQMYMQPYALPQSESESYEQDYGLPPRREADSYAQAPPPSREYGRPPSHRVSHQTYEKPYVTPEPDEDPFAEVLHPSPKHGKRLSYYGPEHAHERALTLPQFEGEPYERPYESPQATAGPNEQVTPPPPDYGTSSHLALYHNYEKAYALRKSEASLYGHASQLPRHHSHDGSYEVGAGLDDDSATDDVPPPPPAHRVTDSHIAPVGSVAPTTYNLSQASSPSHNAHGNSMMLSGPQHAHLVRPSAHSAPASSTTVREHSRFEPAIPTPTMYDESSPQPLRVVKSTKHQSHHYSVPPSLVPGYDPRAAPVEADSGGQRDDESHFDVDDPPGYSMAVGTPRHNTHYASEPDLQQVTPRSHHASLPLVKPVAVSPDPIRVPRKSVSPRPSMSTEHERRHSGVPFSPDSYDAFNPNASSTSINEIGAQYRTPEEAVEVSRQRQREAQRGPPDEPIIGWDGRVIDPSDHLPADTWAPEPERRSPVKTPSQPESRTRPSPQGAQPMPPSSRRSARQSASITQSISTPPYSLGADPQTPSNASRNRLQKKINVSSAAASPNVTSSPLGPYGSSRSTPRSLPRAPPAAADHALREHENYGYDRSQPYSPSDHMKRSPVGGAGPPLPAKVPMRGEQEDYSALSEALSTIDIGGSGRRRAVRRIQY